MTVATPVSPAHTRIIAHRGVHYDHHENTVAAAAAAVALGTDGIEFDVRASRDGELVIFHDDHTADGRLVADQTYQELRATVPGPIARLDEMLDVLAPSDLIMQVELKQAGIEQEVLDAVRARGDDVFARSNFTSFHDAAITAIKELDPSARTTLLLGARLGTEPQDVDPRERLAATRANEVAAHPRLVELGALQLAREVGVPGRMWKVNGDELIRRALLEPDVAAFTTDDPARALQLRAELAAASA